MGADDDNDGSGIDPATNTVFTTLWLQGAIGIVCLLIFECLRKQKEVYAPKLRSKRDRCPPPPDMGLFGWIKSTVSLDDDETLAIVGLDAFVFLRFLKLLFRVFIGCGAFAMVTLIPIYSTVTHGVHTIEDLSMGNLEQGGGRLWASFVAVYIFTFYFLYLLYKEYEYFVTLRQDFLQIGDSEFNPQISYSVLVENVPEEYKSSTRLHALFSGLFPGEVKCARILMNVDPLIKVATERLEYVATLENAVAAYEASDREKVQELKVKDNKASLCGGVKEETVPFCESKIEELTKKLRKQKMQVISYDDIALGVGEDVENGVGDEEAGEGVAKGTHRVPDEDELIEDDDDLSEASVAPTGIVTFKSRRAQAAAMQLAFLDSKFPEMFTLDAPAPSNLIWANVNVPNATVERNSTFTAALLYTGIIFWAVIVAFIAAVSKLSNLEYVFPFLKSLDPVSYALLEGQVPVIVLAVFIAILPMIFTALSMFVEKRKTIVALENEVTKWFFGYQLANVYLMLLGGSIIGQLGDLAQPTKIINLLAESMPAVSTFFINFILVSLLGGVPIFMLRIGPIAIFKIYTSCFNPRALTRRTLVGGPLADFNIRYSLIVPGVAYIMCIAVLYWVIAPLATIAAGLLFLGWYIMWKYHFLYIIVPTYQSGGMYFYKMFDYAFIGLLFSTVTFTAYMGIKESPAAPIIIPLIFIVWFAWSYIHKKFYVISSTLAYDLATAKDNDTGFFGSMETSLTFDDDFYRPEVLTADLKVNPWPYRVDDIPLMDDNNYLNVEYHENPCPSAKDKAKKMTSKMYKSALLALKEGRAGEKTKDAVATNPPAKTMVVAT